jgi:glycosyltransferase involved in cell wall biosynthesis
MNPRLRVAAVFLDLNIGGDENRTLTFCQARDRERLDYLVVTVSGPDAEQDDSIGPMRSRYVQAGVELLDLGEPPQRPSEDARPRRTLVQKPGALLHNVRVLVRRARRLARVLRERRIDVVDAHMGAIPCAALAGRLACVRGIVATDYGIHLWNRPLRRVLAQGAFRQVDTLVSDSRMRCEEMRRWLRIHGLKTAVIPNGVFPPTTTETAATLRRRLALPEDPHVRIIGQISRLLPHKGQRQLLTAAQTVLAREPNAAFLLCGFARDPAYRAELEQQAAALGIADRVRLISYPGPQGDVWAAIDIHVHASLIESSPMAIAEGMSLGKPAVVAAAGGIPEIVEHEKTGLVVPTGQPGPLAEALLRMLREPEFARRMGQAARERYERFHRPEIMARSLEDLFEAAASRGGSRSAKSRTPARVEAVP